jgi:hypothetical protein
VGVSQQQAINSADAASLPPEVARDIDQQPYIG